MTPDAAADRIRAAVTDALPDGWTASARVTVHDDLLPMPRADVTCWPPIYTGTEIRASRAMVGLWPDQVDRDARLLAATLGEHVRAAL